MASFLQFTLDTLAPAGVTLTAPSNSATQAINVTADTTDVTTTGYTMKIWGSVIADANAGINEATAPTLGYSETAKAITLTAGDGVKTLNLAIFDDVGNRTASAPIQVNMITSQATVSLSNITGGASTSSRFSASAGFNQLEFKFSSNQDFTEYKVKAVTTTNAGDSTGSQIGTANGSTGVSGIAGNYTASTQYPVLIKMTDLPDQVNELKTIKVFVKNVAGTWSQA